MDDGIVLFACHSRDRHRECEKPMCRYISLVKKWPMVTKSLKRAASSIPKANSKLKTFLGWFFVIHKVSSRLIQLCGRSSGTQRQRQTD